jgi:hypothetical protein
MIAANAANDPGLSDHGDRVAITRGLGDDYSFFR